MTKIFKVAPQPLWRAAEAVGRFEGAPVDLADGYVHFSTGDQLAETLRRHFAGQTDLVLIAVEADRLGPALRWEPSRGGARFPHLYAPLDLAAVAWVKPLATDATGMHILPDLD